METKYYKGQKENPYKTTDLRYTAWKIEYLLVRAIETDNQTLSDCLSFYLQAGMSDFQKDDDIPAIYKAFLFNRWTEYNGRIDINGFKQFYKDLYM